MCSRNPVYVDIVCAHEAVRYPRGGGCTVISAMTDTHIPVQALGAPSLGSCGQPTLACRDHSGRPLGHADKHHPSFVHGTSRCYHRPQSAAELLALRVAEIRFSAGRLQVARAPGASGRQDSLAGPPCLAVSDHEHPASITWSVVGWKSALCGLGHGLEYEVEAATRMCCCHHLQKNLVGRPKKIAKYCRCWHTAFGNSIMNLHLGPAYQTPQQRLCRAAAAEEAVLHVCMYVWVLMRRCT